MIFIRTSSKIRYISAQQARESFSSIMKLAKEENAVYFICKRGKIAAVIGFPEQGRFSGYHSKFLHWRRTEYKPVACKKTT